MVSGRTTLRVTGVALASAALLLAGVLAGWRAVLLLRDVLSSIQSGPLLGGLSLCVAALGLAASAFRLILMRAHEPWFWIIPGAGVVAQAGLTVLAALWMTHDQVLAGSIAGGVAVGVPALVLGFRVWDMGYRERDPWILVSIVLFEGAAVTLMLTAGHPAAGWAFAVVAGLPVLVQIGFTVGRFARRRLIGRLGRDKSTPFAAQLAGLVLPVGSIVLLGTVGRTNEAPGALIALLVAYPLLAVFLFAVQRVVLGLLIVDLSPAGSGSLGPFRDGDVNDLFESRRGSPLLVSSGMTAAVQRTRARTGLSIDAVWPRIELVLPAEVRKQFRRTDRSITALRVTTASVAITALMWAGLVIGLFRAGLGAASIIAVIVGPPLVVLVLLSGLRRLGTRLYQQRADAVEIYRFDLARSMRLPIPRDPEEFRRAAPVLMGWSRPVELLPFDEPQPQAKTVIARTDPALVEEIRRLSAQQARLTQLIRSPVLDQASADLISESIRERMETLHQSFYLRVGKLIEEGIESSVLGPPLVNFTGFMVIDLRQNGQGRPSREPGEMLSAPVGGLLELAFYVMNHEDARNAPPTLESGDQFFIAEPIQIDGGRQERSVEFEAVADSPTLRSVPKRAGMTVTGDAPAETFFSFRMPDEPGRHEIWFQLYQAGRLVQAVAVHVQARAGRASVNG